MNYIYDIMLNYQKYYYEIYEWKKKDKIKNIIKIPLYRVSDNDILLFKNYNIQIDQKFLNKIKKDSNKNICLISNTKQTIGLLFNNQGQLLKRSSLIYEEEDEANEIAQNLNQIKINYIKKEPLYIEHQGRLELERKEFILNYLKKNNNISTLKYIYYEYFKKECNNISQIKKELEEELKENWTNKKNNIFHTIKIFNQKNILMK